MMASMRRTSFGFRREITVYEYERGLLYRDGKLECVLEPGRYSYWAWEPVDVSKVSLREMSHVVAGQGIVTADRIEVRISLVAQRAAAAGAGYTRYCDDMVFSWRYVPGPPSDFEAAVRGTLHEFGYALHPKKGWQVHQRRDEPEITGVILTRRGGVRIPDAMREAMSELARSRDPRDAQRLAGYQGFEAMVRKRPRE